MSTVAQPGIAPRTLGADATRPVSLVVQAMGGQGGGVLVDWIVDLAEHNGYMAQSTSVPGVAQRTGATLYCIELMAHAHVRAAGRPPVLALMPVPGEVDIVVAAELMEAGRAMQRGLVTPQRTLLITSTHRDYATVEKTVPGNGIADGGAVLAAAGRHARRLLGADMQAIARESGSVISAALFGALAGSGELPFDAAAFEATITRSGVGVQASLRAFRAAHDAVRAAPEGPSDGGRTSGTGAGADPFDVAPPPLPAQAAAAAVEPLRQRIEREFPPAAHAMLGAGLQRVLEFQDLAYGSEYLDRLAALQALLQRCDDELLARTLLIDAARWVAVAMAYDDVIRVADLKTRAARSRRVREEIGAGADEVVGTLEFFHPRREELLGLLPPGLAKAVQARPWLSAWIDPRLARGRRIAAQGVRGALLLHGMAALRRWRRASLRHHTEMAHLDAWLAQVHATLADDPALALELVRCRRLVKGYSDTHARGSSRFDGLQRAAAALRGRGDAAAQLAALRAAALADPRGEQLGQHLQRLGLADAGAPSAANALTKIS